MLPGRSVWRERSASAIAAVEARTGKSLFIRSFTWSVTAWRDLSGNTLPVAPVVAIHEMSIVDRFGAETVIDPARYVLERDAHRPRIAATSLFLPSIPDRRECRIQFDAGFAETWTGLPADLARAVLLLAAHYYENREGARDGRSDPYGVAALLDRYAMSAFSEVRHEGRWSSRRSWFSRSRRGCLMERAVSPRSGLRWALLWADVRAGTAVRRSWPGSSPFRLFHTVSRFAALLTARRHAPEPDQRFRDGGASYRILAVTERTRADCISSASRERRSRHDLRAVGGAAKGSIKRLMAMPLCRPRSATRFTMQSPPVHRLRRMSVLDRRT